MSQVPAIIQKQPKLKTAADYYELRRKGIGFIADLSSRLWTDYNTHDPGITSLEALIYVITDLAYRLGWDIEDILAPAQPSPDPRQPFPNQAFFTAREILTVNPWTPDDFRRLLIDLGKVRNAWVFCKACACDLYYYAACEKDQLKLSYLQDPADLAWTPVQALGLYDVLLELEADPELGDLNDRKVERRFVDFTDPDGQVHPVTMEVRFSDWGLGQGDEWDQFLKEEVAAAEVVSLGATKAENVLDQAISDAALDQYVRDHWETIFYISFAITLAGGTNLTIDAVALRLLGDADAKRKTKFRGPGGLQVRMEDLSPAGFIPRYRQKLLHLREAVDEAKQALCQHRNLDEDYCHIKVVNIEDVAVCADVEVAPDADIEQVQAKIWFAIERYFNPPVPFYTLAELMEAGLSPEEIFNGPEMKQGFIKATDLQAAELKTVLRTSDIIDRLMKIEGVKAVNNLLLAKYDSEGNVRPGYADPDLVNNHWSFDPGKIGASWQLFVTELHQPRLYYNQSRFLFFKNGLPFLPRRDEAYDTLTQLRGEAERPKIKNADTDLSIPAGTFRDPADYAPVQYSFPLTYGIGPQGLPSYVSDSRRAQAKQLKAYLMVFEQFLGNAFAQLAGVADLFSLDNAVEHTYFVREFSDALIRGYSELTSGLTAQTLAEMTETKPEFLDRRNRFLDHLMARFGDQFAEYPLLLADWQGQQVASQRLIDDKISFLKVYPLISHDRGKAFCHRDNPCKSLQTIGLKNRVSLLLGYPGLTFDFTVAGLQGGKYRVTWRLHDGHGKDWLQGDLKGAAGSQDEARREARRYIMRHLVHPEAYEIVPESGKFRLRIRGAAGQSPGQGAELCDTQADAAALKEDLLGWSANERAIIVEHLLLRPKFPGDALYPACPDGPCGPCGEEDPYSFRLTFVMPGWTAPFNTNMDMRGFAERTIRQETPSHLLAKICWVGNDGFVEDPCDPVLTELAGLLQSKALTSGGERLSREEACACATVVYAAFSSFFDVWYADKTLVHFQPEALDKELAKLFAEQVKPAEIPCTAELQTVPWPEIQAVMVKYFHHIALYGWQFERFEDAWCRWLEANATSDIDWTEERLPERLEAILRSNLKDPDTPPGREDLCLCGADILAQYGMDFYSRMKKAIEAGQTVKELKNIIPDQVTICPNYKNYFSDDAPGKILSLLQNRYGAYLEVSYHLWIVLDQLSKLRNTYPVATLHDCDEGRERNPLRLGQTALGSQ